MSSKQQPKVKGVRYIADVLAKYYPSKYKEDKKGAKLYMKVALPKAHEVQDELKAQGKKVTVDNVLEAVRKKRKKIYVSPELLEEKFWFELSDYPRLLLLCSKGVYFTSKLWPGTLEDIEGGDSVEYSEYFAPFVNYINSLKAATQPDEGTDTITDWFVK